VLRKSAKVSISGPDGSTKKGRVLQDFHSEPVFVEANGEFGVAPDKPEYFTQSREARKELM
jgi:hypothetical protein